MIPQSWSKSGLNGATRFQTSDRKIRRVDPTILPLVLRSLESARGNLN